MYVFMKNKPYTFYLHCLLHETQELPEYIFHIVKLPTPSSVFYHKCILDPFEHDDDTLKKGEVGKVEVF